MLLCLLFHLKLNQWDAIIRVIILVQGNVNNIAQVDAKTVVLILVGMAVAMVVVEHVQTHHGELRPKNRHILHPVIVVFQDAQIVLVAAKTVALPDVVPLVMKNARMAAKRLAKEPALMAVKELARPDVKKLVKQDAKIPVELAVKMDVIGHAKIHVKILVKAVVIMFVIKLAKELVKTVVILIVCTIARDVADRLIN